MSAHEAVRLEQEKAGSIAQLAAEAETIAAQAHSSAATEIIYAAVADETIATSLIDDKDFRQVSDAIRAAHLIGVDIETALPVLITRLRRRGTLTARDLAKAIRTHTSAADKTRSATSSQLIAGILLDATPGLRDPQMVTALRERYSLIDARADALVNRAETENASWVTQVLALGRDEAKNRSFARTIAAYRDRWQVTDQSPLGRAPDSSASFAQQADYRRIHSALTSAQQTRGAPSLEAVSPARPTRDL